MMLGSTIGLNVFNWLIFFQVFFIGGIPVLALWVGLENQCDFCKRVLLFRGVVTDGKSPFWPRPRKICFDCRVARRLRE